MVQLNAPQIGEEEIAAVAKVMRSGLLTHGLGAGPMVIKFERAFAKFAEARYAIAVNSGTSGLHLALVAAGVEKGSEVVLPSFTFVATAEVIAMIGAKPVFVDIEPLTYNISADQVEDAVTEKTKAVMPVDLYGLPVDMKPMREVADKHGLAIIEDSCQAHGASYRGKPPGAFADVACWSFYASKNMTTGEGGMITTSSSELAEKMRLMRSHGEKEKYTSLVLGHNYRMPEIEAAIGSVQLRRLPEFAARRQRNAEDLSERLKKAEKLQSPYVPKLCRHSWYLYTLRLKGADNTRRDGVAAKLKEKGISVEAYYRNPIHLMPYYRRFGKRRLPETEKAANQVLSLPVHPAVTMDQIDYIGRSVVEVYS